MSRLTGTFVRRAAHAVLVLAAGWAGQALADDSDEIPSDAIPSDAIPSDAIPSGESSNDGIHVMGAIGDSITAGFNARRFGDNRELGWATGDEGDVLSHLLRLRAQGSDVQAFNDAIAGSKVDDLHRQITRNLRHPVDYVTVTIGANDVCTWPDDYGGQLAEFETTLDTEISRIVETRPNVKIMLPPIPDIYNLWAVASSHDGCYGRWQLFNICQPLLGRDRTDAERAAFRTRWELANAAITRVAEAHSDHVLHDPELAHTAFTWEHISPLDCFHPNVLGQNLLSERAWMLYLTSLQSSR
jgi:lysophospholipase L1-like esterase